jgi:hypothetical protein
MALTLIGKGAVAFSAANGASVSPAFPAGILEGDFCIMVCGQKPITHEGGVITTPSGWTTFGENIGGGYGVAPAADTGTMRIKGWYLSSLATGSEGGTTVAISLSDSNVAWAQIYHYRFDYANFPSKTPSFQARFFQDTLAGNLQSSLMAEFNTPTIAGQMLLMAFAYPTDVATVPKFSAHNITQSGATITETEQEDFADATGNDIGGLVVSCTVTGTGTGDIQVNATAAATNTNVRGSGFVLRIRELNIMRDVSVGSPSTVFGTPTVIGPLQTVSPAGIAKTTTFGAPTVGRGPVSVAPAGIAPTAAFGTPHVGFPPQTVSPSGIASTLAFGDLTTTLGPVTVSPASIAPTTAFGTPYVANTQILSVNGIASTVAFGSPTLDVEPVLQAYMSELKFENASMDIDTFRERFLFGGPVGFEDFRLLVPGDYKYQDAKVRVDAISQDSTIASISALTLIVDIPDVKDRGRATFGAVVHTVNFNRTFRIDPPEVIALQVGGTTVGRVRVSNITLTSFDVEIRNASDALMAGTVSWMAHGK